MKEIWKDIPGYEGFYQASNTGKVKSLNRMIGHWVPGKKRKWTGRILKPIDRGNGYPFVTLYKNGIPKQISVHKLIALTFLGEPPAGYFVNHKDLSRDNNRIENLEYMTNRENQIHARKFKTWPSGTRGEDHPKAILCDSQVIEIRKIYNKGKLTRKEIAKMYNVKLHVIVDVILGRTWKHLL